MTSYINHFRPVYEGRAVVVWLLALFLLPFSGMPYAWLYAIVALVLLSCRVLQVSTALKFRMSISTKWLTSIEVSDLLTIQKKMREEKDSMYLGTGFEWTQKHCQIAHDIFRMPSTEIPGLPRWLEKSARGRKVQDAIEQLFAPASSKRDRAPQGSSWIHGMEPKKDYVPLHYKALGGHTGVPGTTGSGKTRTYEVISTQVIHLGDVLICIDPKNDREWMLRVKRECERAGRKFLYFNQAKPSESIRLNPIENWSQPSEIPNRISQLLEEGPFRNFAHLFIDRAVKGELYVGDKPNLRSILNYAQAGVAHLLERALKKFFIEMGYESWEQDLAADTQKNSNGPKGGALKAWSSSTIRAFLFRATATNRLTACLRRTVTTRITTLGSLRQRCRSCKCSRPGRRGSCSLRRSRISATSVKYGISTRSSNRKQCSTWASIRYRTISSSRRSRR
jgi:conjugal transfer pilus assembly protein TraD